MLLTGLVNAVTCVLARVVRPVVIRLTMSGGTNGLLFRMPIMTVLVVRFSPAVILVKWLALEPRLLWASIILVLKFP